MGTAWASHQDNLDKPTCLSITCSCRQSHPPSRTSTEHHLCRHLHAHRRMDRQQTRRTDKLALQATGRPTIRRMVAQITRHTVRQATRHTGKAVTRRTDRPTARVMDSPTTRVTVRLGASRTARGPLSRTQCWFPRRQPHSCPALSSPQHKTLTVRPINELCNILDCGNIHNGLLL